MTLEEKQSLCLHLKKEPELLKQWMFEQVEVGFNQDPLFLKGLVYFSQLEKLGIQGIALFLVGVPTIRDYIHPYRALYIPQYRP